MKNRKINTKIKGCISENINENFIIYHPKSSGSDVNDISFSPNTVKLFNWEKPAGKRGIGFELKSATCKLRRCLMSSGMSAISKINVKIKIRFIIDKYYINLLITICYKINF